MHKNSLGDKGPALGGTASAGYYDFCQAPKKEEGEAKPLPLADCVTLVRLLGPRRPDRHCIIGAAVF